MVLLFIECGETLQTTGTSERKNHDQMFGSHVLTAIVTMRKLIHIIFEEKYEYRGYLCSALVSFISQMEHGIVGG